MPVAANCTVAPFPTDGLTGATAIPTSTGDVTVNVVDPLTEPSIARIPLVPAVTPLANPPDVMVATLVFAELQVTNAVRFSELPFLKCPVAVNCWVVPAAIEGFAGATTIEVSPVSSPVPFSANTRGLPKPP